MDSVKSKRKSQMNLQSSSSHAARSVDRVAEHQRQHNRSNSRGRDVPTAHVTPQQAARSMYKSTYYEPNEQEVRPRANSQGRLLTEDNELNAFSVQFANSMAYRRQPIGNTAAKYEQNYSPQQYQHHDDYLTQKNTLDALGENMKRLCGVNSNNNMIRSQSREDGLQRIHRTNNTDSSSARLSDLEQMERKLGAVEYDLRQHKIETQRQLLLKQQELDETVQALHRSQSNVENYRLRFEQNQRKLEESNKRQMNLESYLEQMPTSETQEKIRMELQKHRLENERLKELHNSFKSDYGRLNSEYTTCRKCLDASKLREKVLEEELSSIRNELQRFADSNTAVELTRQLDEMKVERKQMQSDLDSAYKVHDLLKRKLKLLDEKSRTELAIHQERVTQEEELVVGLRKEISDKDNDIYKLRMNNKELSCQRDDLYKRLEQLETQIDELQAGNKQEIWKLICTLINECTACTEEIQAVTKFCRQRMDSQDPDLSLMLNSRSFCNEDDFENADGDHLGKHHQEKDEINLNFLSEKVKQVRDLRKDVEVLKQDVCNKYAEELGDNMACNQQ